MNSLMFLVINRRLGG